MPDLLRRLGPIALAAVLVATLAPAAVAADDLTISEAEARVASLLNAQRHDAGLRALRIDPRLAAIARGRSEDMVANDYFGHQEPDGDWAWDIMSRQGIRWFAAGEIIAWNMWASLSDSAASASQQWRDSAPHRALLLSKDYNYFGAGLAVDQDGKKVWTVVFIKGPDRTGAWARFRTDSNTSADALSVASGGYRRMTIKWKGNDIRLQVLTAGLSGFQVQRRRAGSSVWTTIFSDTDKTEMTRKLRKGVVYEFRVRARDRKGNVGAWRSIFIRP